MKPLAAFHMAFDITTNYKKKSLHVIAKNVIYFIITVLMIYVSKVGP